jgi:hypothetical protein
MSVPHDIVNIVIEILVVSSIHPDFLAIAQIGVQFHRLAVLEVQEFPQIEDIFSAVVLPDNGYLSL